MIETFDTIVFWICIGIIISESLYVFRHGFKAYYRDGIMCGIGMLSLGVFALIIIRVVPCNSWLDYLISIAASLILTAMACILACLIMSDSYKTERDDIHYDNMRKTIKL